MWPVAESGVRLGVTKTWVGSSSISITCPPENFAPTYCPVLLRLVWQATQLATTLARYSPRSTVGPEGDSAGTCASGLGGLMTNAMSPLPIRLYLMSGTAFSTGGCDRRNEI